MESDTWTRLRETGEREARNRETQVVILKVGPSVVFIVVLALYLVRAIVALILGRG